jgi:hypothetical protein
MFLKGIKKYCRYLSCSDEDGQSHTLPKSAFATNSVSKAGDSVQQYIDLQEDGSDNLIF